MRRIFLLVILALMYPCASQAGTIEYSVVQNNRSLLSAYDDYKRDLSDYLICTQYSKAKGCDRYLAGSGCGDGNDATACTPELMRRSYATKLRYNQETNDYDPDLAADANRWVEFHAPVEFRNDTYDCELKITVGSATLSTAQPCSTGMKLDVPYGVNPHSGRLEASGTMTMAVYSKDGAAIANIEDTFYSHDILILAFGDSFTAGEGNPLSNANDAKKSPPGWIEPRCSRSVFSYPYIAAAMLSLAEKQHSVTVVNYACSGATTFKGLLGPYEGVLTREQVRTAYKRSTGQPNLPPQINQATTFLASIPGRRPDYILLSIGVNDVSVVELLQALASNSNLESERKKIDELRKECPDDKRHSSMRISFNCLKQRLTEVRSAIDRMRPHNVLVLEYPNPLTRNSSVPNTREPALCFSDKTKHAADKKLLKGYLNCRAGSFVGWVLRGFTDLEELTAKEIVFAKDRFFVPLKKSIRDGLQVGLGGWAYLKTHGNLQRRGFCASPSHYHTFAASIQRTGSKPGGKCFSTGTLHPNVFGHYFTAVSVLAHLRNQYFNNDDYKEYKLHSMTAEQFEHGKNGFAWAIWNYRKMTDAASER